jgi:hypothetical protein
MSFDWQTEENIQWDEPPRPERKPEPAPKNRRWRWLLLLLLLVLVGASLGAYWVVQQRVETATTDATEDVLASHVLIAHAAQDADAELVATFLSGRDRDWSAAIESAVMDGEYQNRESFGLTWLPTDPATAVISTTLNPLFNSAEVTSTQTYAFPIGNGLTETVNLRQTAVYRLGPDRWLLAPPEDDFWGETRTKEGFYLTLHYPARDEALAQRLALDMDTALAALCARPAFACPDGFHLQVEFTADPASLSPQFGAAAFVDESWWLRLPTPTLVGYPQDETGYQVWARGYAAQLSTAVMRQLTGTAAVAEGPLQQAWLAWELDRLALRPYPLIPADLEALAEEGVTLQTGERLWATGEPADSFAYALIRFLIQDLQVSSRSIIDQVADNQVQTYAEWLLALADGRYTLEEMELRWQTYLQES